MNPPKYKIVSPAASWRASRQWLDRNRSNLRLALRVTAAALLAFALGRLAGFTQGYWAVFTAIVVIQQSQGGSFIAALDYFVGTLAGAVYGVALAAIVPLDNVYVLGAALAVALAPLAFLAAVRRNFRVAPITAAIVLIIPALQQTSALEPALLRVLEIAIGSAAGILVSRFFLPSRAHHIVAEAAGNFLKLAARLASLSFAGFAEKRNLNGMVRLQDGMRRLLIRLDGVVAEAARERSAHLADDAGLEPLLRTLRRLRLDFVVLGRAASATLPTSTRAHLLPPLARVSASVRDTLNAYAASLADRKPPTNFDDTAFAAYAAAMSAMRRAGGTRDLSDEEVSRIFALGFALDQLRRNLGDLSERVAEFARE